MARQLTSTAGAKTDAQFTPDSNEVFYLEQGRITVIPIETRQARAVAVTAEMDVDFAHEKMEVFRQAWTYMRDGFYDDKFHGVDWDGVRTQYAPRIAGAQTPDEMRRLLNLMVGELNASHMGVSAAAAARPAVGPSAGGSACASIAREYEKQRPAQGHRGHPARPGGDHAAGRSRRLPRRGGRQPIIGRGPISTSCCSHASTADVARRSPQTADWRRRARGRGAAGHSSGTEKNLLYREWVEWNRAYVAKASSGRLGYVHMNDMSEGALQPALSRSRRRQPRARTAWSSTFATTTAASSTSTRSTCSRGAAI